MSSYSHTQTVIFLKPILSILEKEVVMIVLIVRWCCAALKAARLLYQGSVQKVQQNCMEHLTENILETA